MNIYDKEFLLVCISNCDKRDCDWVNIDKNYNAFKLHNTTSKCDTCSEKTIEYKPCKGHTCN